MDGLRCQVRTVERTRFCRVLTRTLNSLGLVLSLSFLGPIGCSAPDDCNAQSSAPQIVYRLGESTPQWLDSPFPSAHFQDADGFIDWETLPNPYSVELVDFYRDIAQEEVAGAGLTSPAFIQFTQPLDLRSLPRGNTDATVSPESSVFLVDIDPESPERGNLIPFRWTWNSEATPFLPSYTLSVAPSWGRPLRPDTLYAWVFTRALRASTGGSIERAPWSRALLSDAPGDICTNAAPVLEKGDVDSQRQMFRQWLKESGRPGDSIAGHFTFRTQPLFQDLLDAKQWLQETDEPPKFSDSYGVFEEASFKERNFQWSVSDAITYRTVSTTVRLPNFQEGTVPYSRDGGFYREGGALTPYRFEDVRSFISFPLDEAPADGWPVVLYIHGTGGDVASGHASTAGRLAAQGFAMVSMELPLHGARAEGRSFDIGVSTFNFLNPAAGRANFRQGAIDILSFLDAISKGLSIPAGVTGLETPTKLRSGAPHIFGHSQGGLSGAIAMPFHESQQGWVLSGAGGGLSITLLERKDPVDFEALIRFLLEFNEEDELDPFHPILALIQTAVDITDPIHFARRSAELSDQPSVLITNGCWDAQTPYKTTDAMALALGAPLVEPISREDNPFESPLGETSTNPVPQDGRLLGYVEWCETLSRDDHFVAFKRPQAIEATMYFLRDTEAGAPVIEKPIESDLR